MPYAEFICANASNLEPKQVHYNFGNECLDDILKQGYPWINEYNSQIVVGDEIIINRKIPIRVCKLIDNLIVIFKHKYQLVSVYNEETKEMYKFYMAPDQKISDLIEQIKGKTKLDKDDFLNFENQWFKDDSFTFSIRNSNNQKSFIELKEQSKKKELVFVLRKKVNCSVNVNVLIWTGRAIHLSSRIGSSIEELKNLIFEIDSIPTDEQRLIMGGKQLEDGRTLEDYHIGNESTIHLVRRLRGGGGQMFADVSDTKGPTKLEWSSKAPYYRQADPGLCLEGKCKNKRCSAYNKMVVINMGNNVVYELEMPNSDTNCPMCEQHVNPITCAFNNCEWRYFGIKRESDGSLKRVKGEWTKADNSYYRFDPEKNGLVKWSSLAIECGRYLSKKCDEALCITSKQIANDFRSNLMKQYQICPICLENYNHHKNIPLLLPCQHNLCSECSKALWGTNQAECPICRAKHDLTAAQIPKARFIIDYLESNIA